MQHIVFVKGMNECVNYPKEKSNGPLFNVMIDSGGIQGRNLLDFRNGLFKSRPNAPLSGWLDLANSYRMVDICFV